MNHPLRPLKYENGLRIQSWKENCGGWSRWSHLFFILFNLLPEDTDNLTSEPEDTDNLTSEPEDTDNLTAEPEDTDDLTAEPEDTDKLSAEPEDINSPSLFLTNHPLKYKNGLRIQSWIKSDE